MSDERGLLRKLVSVVMDMSERVRHLETAELLHNAVQIRGVDVQNTAPSDGDVLQYDATDARWEPTAIVHDAVKIRGVDVQSATPSDSNLLVYDGTDGRWEPGPLRFQCYLKEIASGAIDVTGINYVRVNTESSASTDNLDTINGGVQGQLLVLQPHAVTRDVVVRHAAGNIRLNGMANFTMDHVNDKLVLIYSADNFWCEIGRGDNST